VLYRESLELNRALGDSRYVAVVLNNLGNVAFLRGEHTDAKRWYERSLEIHRADGRKHGVRVALTNLAQVLNAQADVPLAAKVAAEALALCAELSDAWGISTSLLVLGEVALAQGHVTRSTRLLAGVSHLRESVGMAFPRDEQTRFESAVTRTRTCLEPADFEAAWQDGLGKSLEQTIADALASEPLDPVAASASASDPQPRAAQMSMPDPDPETRAAQTSTSHPDPLTRREREVLVLVGRGLSNRKIAQQLVISEQTAAVHVKHILAKLDCSSRAQAAVWAAQAGLLSTTTAAA
jgi:non-specific serine/threonine protein kinase